MKVSYHKFSSLHLFKSSYFDSPWSLFSVVIQQGRTAEAEAEFERLLGVSEAKFAMSQLSKVDRGEDTDTVKFSELLHGHHSKGI